MKIIKRMSRLLITSIILGSVIFQINLPSIHAQEPDDEAGPIIVPPTGRLELSFEQLGYENQELDNNNIFQGYNFDLPGNFQVLPAQSSLDLVMSHFPEVPEKPAVLEIRVNREQTFFTELTQENAISSTTQLEITDGILQDGRNSILFNLDSGGTCREPAGPIRVVIDKDTTLNFEYEQQPYPTDLGLYPFPFSENSLLDIGTTIVLPNQPTSDEISAAATIAAGLGQRSGGDIRLSTVVADNLTPEIQNNNHLIIIGRPETNPLLGELDFPIPIDNASLEPAQGILQEIVSPWNEFRLVLGVSSLDNEGIIKAANALNRQAHFLGMRGPVAIVVALRAVPRSDNLQLSSFTLASLGYEDQIFYGSQPQNYTFDFTLPLGWQLEEPPYLMLKFSHASIISPESTLDMKLNGVPIASTLLDENNSDEGELNIPLPARLLKAGRNRLEARVEMGLLDVHPCDGLNNQKAWTVISRESEIFLPYNTVDLVPDLSFFPYPFSQGSGTDQTLLVLPDQPSSEIFDQLIQLVTRLGSGTGRESTSIQVKYASEVAQDSRQNHHLILLGTPAENVLLSEINDSLPQPFADDNGTLKPLVVDTVALLPDSSRDAGLMQILGSPWNEENTILALTGTSPEGVELAVQTLLYQPRQLEGNLAVVEPAFDPLTGDSPQISIYSVDTQEPEEPVEEASRSAAEMSVTGEVLTTLADRWWR